MRIFTAFPIEEEARRELYAGYGRVRKDLDAVKWVAEENLHITLIFFGEMTKEELDRLLGALEAYPHDPEHPEPKDPRLSRFTVEYRGVECFPPRGKPKVIYSRITAGTERCIEVWSRITGILGGRGGVKPYIPHITLGRIKAKGFYPRPGSYEEISGGIEVSSFGVFESKLTPDGPVYRPVQSYPLGDKTV
ncbi:MAG: RNA 2',3'-cyclic phosphodiesterase [Spirochaetia bacterium]